MKKSVYKFSTLAVSLALLFMLSNCTTPKYFLKSEDFDGFYTKFHADSVFQLSRIQFPLEGSLTNSEGEHSWTKENWTILTVPVLEVDTSMFNVEFSRTTNLFIQKSWIENSGFSVVHKFELIRKRWFLVYAQESNL